MREFGSEFPIEKRNLGFVDQFKKFSSVEFLSTGREALGLLAESIDSDGGRILLPAYSCDSMIQPFSRRGWSIFYYPLNPDLTVNEAELISLCEKKLPKVVLLMNYFGLSETNRIASLIKLNYKNILTIEDFTHVLFTPNILHNTNVDYFIASIRKWLGINDGAVLLSNKTISSYPKNTNLEFVKFRYEAQNLKFQYLSKKDNTYKENYLKSLKKAELALEDYKAIHMISAESYKELNETYIDSIVYRRKENFYHLFSSIKTMEEIGFPENMKSKIIECPFSLPIIVKNRDVIQLQFAKKGLYAPILWPINSKARHICRVSSMMSDNMLSIPIDQRYDYEDIEDIVKIIFTTIKEVN